MKGIKSESALPALPPLKNTPSGEGEKRGRGKEKGIGELEGGWNWWHLSTSERR
jgi:hypothetical protein